MNLSFYIAKRYLFSKKSHNAINIISGISAAGVCIASLALVCVLSVFNGFESLVQNLFSAFDPDLKITLVEGKTFSVNDERIAAVRKLDNIAFFTESIEENAMLRYDEKQMPGTIKGVSDNFRSMTQIDSIIYKDGSFLLNDGTFNYAVSGAGLAISLGLKANDIYPLHIYAPKRTGKINLSNPESGFNVERVYISCVFSVQQTDYDNKYLIVPIALARDFFDYDADAVSAIELKLSDEKAINKTKKQIEEILGSEFLVKNRYEQQESFFRIMQVEKWITYFILSFILLIAVFNIIGSLSMLIIDKKDDIEILRHLGADKKLIQRIFLFEGWLISIAGAIIGIVLGVIICLLQQYFGFIKLAGGNDYIVQAYPVVIQFIDIILVFVTVCVMGFLSVNYPVRQLSKTYEYEDL